MAKTFTKGRTLTILLTISIIANCAMGYYLRLALFDLKNAEELNIHYASEIEKINNPKPTKFDLSTAKPEVAASKKTKFNFGVPLPEPKNYHTYTPTPPQVIYYDTTYNNSLENFNKKQQEDLEREINERRLIRLEGKMNNYELERDFRIFTGRSLYDY